MKHFAEYFTTDKPLTADEYSQRLIQANKPKAQRGRMFGTIKQAKTIAESKVLRQANEVIRVPDNFINFNGLFTMAQVQDRFEDEFIEKLSEPTCLDTDGVKYNGLTVSIDLPTDCVEYKWESVSILDPKGDV